MTHALIVGAGGFVGAICRFAVVTWVGRFGSDFPWGILVANVAGSLLIGLIVGVGDGRQALSDGWRLFLVVGVLGGFTTFSSFSYDTLSLLRAENLVYAVGNVVLSVGLGLGAVAIGYVAGRGAL